MKSLVLGVWLAVLGACSTVQSAQWTDGGQDAAAELTRLDDNWSAAARRRDVDAVASFYADDAIAYPPNEPPAIGRTAAKRVWAAYFAEPSFSISWKTLHAEAAPGADVGYTTGSYEDVFKGPDGKLVHEKGKYLCVWKRQKDGQWKAIHDMWNVDGSTPPALVNAK